VANICTVYAVITGDPLILSELYSRIQQQDINLTDNHPMLLDTDTSNLLYGLCCHRRNEFDITLTQACPWKPKEEAYIDLSDMYPDLTIEVAYEEAADQVYGDFTVIGGSCIESQELTEEQWLERHDDEYLFEKKQIETLTYEEFLESYTEWDVSCDPKYVYLGKDIVARIKDTDLPLFMNVDWMDETINRQYKDRYSTFKEAL